MGNLRRVAIVVDATEALEAAGVRIRRSVGNERLIVLDPILLVDHLHVEGSGQPHRVGFPRHPHRGIETLTLVRTGRVNHKDSLGNDASVGAGGAQWMRAGRGIFHEEMLQVEAGGNEALQLWFNLPQAEKRAEPLYAAAERDAIPTVQLPDGTRVQVVAGTFEGVEGAFLGIAARPTVVIAEMPTGASFETGAPAGETTVAFVLRGTVELSDGDGLRSAEGPRLVIFSDGDAVSMTAVSDADVVFVSARPLGEPVMQYRSIVMNTPEDMRQAIEDLERGTFA